MLDLAIVGGGPAGLFAAARCAEAGLDVVLLEEHPRIGEPTHCTGIISLETADLTKVPDEIVLNRLTRARVTSPGGARWHAVWEAADREQLVAIDRGAFDRSLAEQARAAGAVVRTGARVDGIASGPRGVDLSAGEEVVRTRACVLACGVSYRLQRQLGLGLPGHVVHSAQLEVDARPSGDVEIYLGREVAPEGFAWMVPVRRDGRHRMKVGVMARGDASAYLQRFLARPENRARLAAEPGPPVRRLLPLRPITRTYAERLLVVGDAGGFTKPTTGGGIFYGLLTASLAAETLIEGFQAGRLDGEFLARYERRWRERLQQELRVAGWLRRLLTKSTDAELDLLVRAVAREEVEAIIRRAARFNWHRDVILALMRQPRIAAVLLRSLFR
ncbi:MAG: NAD(P)/FAD-dependent oxidoreductase [Candidatus Rokubacteria bacterium]|nr:NAD(P)/FAD-dependent oxidoreductase [Candidatus Rokubacteria bacterium]